MERGGIRFPVGQKRKAAEAGQGTSWKENQDEAYQHQHQIAAVLRLKRVAKKSPALDERG